MQLNRSKKREKWTSACKQMQQITKIIKCMQRGELIQFNSVQFNFKNEIKLNLNVLNYIILYFIISNCTKLKKFSPC